MSPVLLIDNYDSFTYNLVHYLEIAGAKVKVVRNKEIPIEDIRDLRYSGVVVSPGPKRPENAGMLMDTIKLIPATLPLLGICLGMQAIGQLYNVPLIHAPVPVHGKVSLIHHHQKGIFADIKSPTPVMRYHSLILKNELPTCLEGTSHTEDGLLMSLRHIHRPIVGVQFHPESIGTDFGQKMISNWVDTIKHSN